MSLSREMLQRAAQRWGRVRSGMPCTSRLQPVERLWPGRGRLLLLQVGVAGYRDVLVGQQVVCGQGQRQVRCAHIRAACTGSLCRVCRPGDLQRDGSSGTARRRRRTRLAWARAWPSWAAGGRQGSGGPRPPRLPSTAAWLCELAIWPAAVQGLGWDQLSGQGLARCPARIGCPEQDAGSRADPSVRQAELSAPEQLCPGRSANRPGRSRTPEVNGLDAQHGRSGRRPLRKRSRARPAGARELPRCCAGESARMTSWAGAFLYLVAALAAVRCPPPPLASTASGLAGRGPCARRAHRPAAVWMHLQTISWKATPPGPRSRAGRLRLCARRSA